MTYAYLWYDPVNNSQQSLVQLKLRFKKMFNECVRMHRVLPSLICYKMVTNNSPIENSKKSLWLKTDYPFTKIAHNNTPIDILLAIKSQHGRRCYS